MQRTRKRVALVAGGEFLKGSRKCAHLRDKIVAQPTGMIQDAQNSEKEGTFYFVWEGDSFRLVRYIRKKYPSERLGGKTHAN